VTGKSFFIFNAKRMIKTAEFITPKHPDKICDFIADTILDAYLAGDPASRVAVEVMGGHGKVRVTGEVTSRASVDIAGIVKSIEGEHIEVDVLIDRQSPEIAHGVDLGGAGDQGIMVGFACRDTANFMPLEYETARNLCQELYKTYPYDGKVQVTMEGKKVLTVVASFQNSVSSELGKLARAFLPAETYLINPAGEWKHGGFEADSGLSGRKLVADSYGPQVSIGGGSFSGKDYTKVDRSGAYMARKIAVDYLEKFNSESVTIKLAYAIGRVEPVMAVALMDGNQTEIKGYDLSPAGIKKALNLETVAYADTAVWGHFGRNFTWR
jgi:S-adenosylmethionine synthetase